ncbi:MAG TPA: mandelate racemase/muconate lactonizing enzyme family protein [Chloroflexota bacterium]|nr:mandelate racemase/muconate lactonizing enzyme family protein [Chloroflexota bacterium]
MKVTRIETIQHADFANLLWVQVHTDDGLVGLGETYRGVASAAAYVHEMVAPYLLGKDPRAIERHHSTLSGSTTHRSMGAEVRGLSAIDIALWDLFGQSVGLPVHQCMGGPVRDRIRIYNTCAGYHYGRRAGVPGQSFAASWGMGAQQGPYEDLVKWQEQERAGELARELLDMGITAMKIWPFDQFADETGGQHITPSQIEKGLKPFRQIRDAVGMRMEIAVELHSRWNLQAVLRIVEALDEVRPMWYEDPIRMDAPAALAELAAKTRVPITASETLAGRHAFRELLERRAVGIVMLDPGWVGGLTEAKAIASLAAAYHRPVAPHDCTGPVVYAAGCHLCLAAPNAMIQEGVRAYYHGWYPEAVTALPIVENGYVRPPEGPGLGTRLRDDFLASPRVTRQVSELS